MSFNDTHLLTVAELADVLHMDVGTIRNRLSRGDAMPPSIKIGRRRLFPVSELSKWLTAQLTSNEQEV